MVKNRFALSERLKIIKPPQDLKIARVGSVAELSCDAEGGEGVIKIQWYFNAQAINVNLDANYAVDGELRASGEEKRRRVKEEKIKGKGELEKRRKGWKERRLEETQVSGIGTLGASECGYRRSGKLSSLGVCPLLHPTLPSSFGDWLKAKLLSRLHRGLGR